MSKFSEMIETYFKKGLELSPIWASDLGFEEYDGVMPEGGKADILADEELEKDFLNDIKSFNDNDLSAEERIDKKVLEYSLRLSRFNHEKIALWQRYARSADVCGHALYSLVSKDSVPAEKRIANLMKILKQIPLYLENSKELLEKPVWIWIEMAIDSCRRMKGFIDFIENFGQNTLKNADKLKELKLDCINVKNAFKAYEHWLYDMQPHAVKDFAMSEDDYNELLKKRLIPYSASEILAIGENYVKEITEKMNILSAQIDPSLSAKELTAKIKKGKQLKFSEILHECKRIMQEAKDFVIDNDFADIPEEELLVVEETPIFMRHLIPFAAYSPPGKFEEIQKGIYMMTPSELDANTLMDFSIEDLISTSVHEGYPGHHLQFACANLNTSLARIYSHATEFVEGWAHYCEDATADAGFYNLPEANLIKLSDMLWRAWRIIIDVKLSTGKMTFEEAVNHLVEDAGLEYIGALAEVKRYTYTPAYQLSYLLGKHMILELKERLKRKYPETWSLKGFHNTMLYAGSLPITIMENLLEEKFSKA